MKKFIYFLLLLGQASCLNMVEPNHQIEYIEVYNSFDNNVIDHFPKKLSNNYISFIPMLPKIAKNDFNNASVSLTILVYSNKEYKKEKEKLISKSKFVKKSTDNYFLFLNTNFIKKNIKKYISKYDTLIPVPSDLFNKYDKKSEIAVIDYKAKNVRKKLKHKNNLLKKWENGYSKGYTFNDINQTITYWLVIW